MATKLVEYKAKRDFSKTAEPSGRQKVCPSKIRRFVIQKHAATRLHYDLRLELDGVFKSWAVTKGPSLSTRDRRLAVEVEDHPLDYGDFEGTIPKGQYGGGTVQLWDRGHWQPMGNWTAEDQLRRGKLDFLVEGKRLHGSLVLARLRIKGQALAPATRSGSRPPPRQRRRGAKANWASLGWLSRLTNSSGRPQVPMLNHE
jgi:bifunctional non-homologous end joining protein LigD